jgi:hypothetical protein
MASYPSAPVIFPARADATPIFAAHMNGVQDEIAAIEAALLGTIAHPVTPGQSLSLPNAISTVTLTADAHNYNPPGLATAFHLRVQGDAARSITGLQALPAGRLLCLTNIGAPASILTLTHDDPLSTAGNRLLTSNGTAVVLPPSGNALFYYDAASSAWRVVASSAASGVSINWQAYTPSWVSTGTAPALGNGVLLGRYAQVGKVVHAYINFTLGSTSTQGTGTWYFTLPPGLPAAAVTTIGHARTRRGTNSLATVLVEAALTRVGWLEIGQALANTGAGVGVPAAWATGNGVSLNMTYETP